jgi:hypothetical protein
MVFSLIFSALAMGAVAEISVLVLAILESTEIVREWGAHRDAPSRTWGFAAVGVRGRGETDSVESH